MPSFRRPIDVEAADQEVVDIEARDTGRGLPVADLPSKGLPSRTAFTFDWPEPAKWEQADFAVTPDGERNAETPSALWGRDVEAGSLS